MSDFLKEVKQFSPEEMDQFKLEIENNEEAASIFDTQMGKMTAYERAEMESLYTGQQLQDADVPEAQAAMAQRQELQDSNKGHYDDTVTDNIHGMAQAAVSQLPFGEKILAAGEATFDVATGKADSFGQAMADNVVENMEQTKEFSDEHMYLDIGAKAVSEMGQLWAGGALLKGGIKALGYTDKVAKAGKAAMSVKVLGGLVPKYGGQVVVEGALQTARDLDMDGNVTLGKGLTTLGGNFALAATFGKLGDVAEAGLKGVAGRIASTVTGERLATMKTSLVKNISTWSLDSSVNKINKFVIDSQDTLNPHIGLRDSEEYFGLMENAFEESGVLESVVESLGKKNFQKAMTQTKKAHEFARGARNTALNKLAKLGKNPEAILSDSDSLDLVSSFHDSINYSKLSDQAKGMAQPIVEKLMRLSRKSGADLYNFVEAAGSPKLPGSIANDLKVLKNLDPSFEGGIGKFLMQARAMAYDKMDDAASMAYKSGDDNALVAFNDFIKYNKMQRVLDHNTTKLVSETQATVLRDELGRGAVGSAVHKTMNEMKKEIAMLGFAGAGAGAAAVTVGASSLPITGGLAGLYIIPKLTTHFRNAPTSIAKVGNKVLKGMAAEGDNIARELTKFDQIADMLDKTTNTSLVQNAVMSFMNASRDTEEYDNFQALYSTAKASSHFMSNPLERNSQSIIANRGALNDLLRDGAPELLQSLNEAISSGEEIGPIMDAIMKMPEAAPFVKDGVGFDGKVYTPEDKAALEKDLVNDIFIPGDYKVQMVKALRETGTIPEMEKVPKRQPRRHEKRDKKRPY